MRVKFPLLPILWFGFASIVTFSLSQCDTPSGEDGGPVNQDPFWPTKVPKTVVFERDVKPFLEILCLECHNSIDASENADLNLETRQLALTTGRHAPVIRPGDPDNSLIIQLLRLDDQHALGMPPSPDKVWGARLKILEKWIAQGLEWPEEMRLQRPQDNGE